MGSHVRGQVTGNIKMELHTLKLLDGTSDGTSVVINIFAIFAITDIFVVFHSI